MEIRKIHSWDKLTIAAARELQQKLATQVVIAGGPENVSTIAAGDLAFSKDGMAYGAVLLLTYPEFDIVESHTGTEKVRFPYIPGFLSFREAPLLIELFARLSRFPDLVMIDGQGIAHPRGLGIAAHIGLFLNIPTIGVAKSRLIGEYDEPGTEKGQWSYLRHNNGTIGMVVRTRRRVKPIYLSVGNEIDYEHCLKWLLKCCTRYRIPEPTRKAHIAVAKFKKTIAER